MPEPDSRKMGLFGGTFNPVHYGHLRAAEEVREMLGLSGVLFIPSANPHLKDIDLAPAECRYEMTKLAVKPNPHFSISDIEYLKTGKSYTVETLLALRGLYPEKEFYFILGIDAFLDIPSWHQPERLAELANFVIISRPGYAFSDMLGTIEADPEIIAGIDSGRLKTYRMLLKTGMDIHMVNVSALNISATAIRRQVREKRSIKYLLPESVESYIISNKLYEKTE